MRPRRKISLLLLAMLAVLTIGQVQSKRATWSETTTVRVKGGSKNEALLKSLHLGHSHHRPRKPKATTDSPLNSEDAASLSGDASDSKKKRRSGKSKQGAGGASKSKPSKSSKAGSSSSSSSKKGASGGKAKASYEKKAPSAPADSTTLSDVTSVRARVGAPSKGKKAPKAKKAWASSLAGSGGEGDAAGAKGVVVTASKDTRKAKEWSGKQCSPLKYRESPTNFSRGKRKECKVERRYKEWSEVAMVYIGLHNPDTVPALFKRIGDVYAKEAETVVFEPNPARHAAWRAHLTMENRFLVHSAHGGGALGELLNRLTRMANAEVVVLVREGEQDALNSASLTRATDLFKALPQLGLLSLSAGYDAKAELHGIGAGPVDGTLQGLRWNFFMYSAAVKFGPLIVRRSALLAVGLWAVGLCPAACEEWISYELSARMWRAGFTVGVADGGAKDRGAKLGGCSGRPDTDGFQLFVKKNPGVLAAVQRQMAGLLQRDEGPSGRRAAPSQAEVVAGGCTDSPAGYRDTEGALTLQTSCKPKKEDKSLAPEVALVIQYFRRPNNIKRILEGLRKAYGKGQAVEVIVNNDSESDHDKWMEVLTQPLDFLIDMPNVHEIRGYNRMAKFSNAKYIAFLQDDDEAKSATWLAEALKLFSAFPKMALLGGFRGRLDYGSHKAPTGQVDGPKYGPPSKAARCCLPIEHTEPKSGLPFTFMYRVNMGPMLARRAVFLELGLFNQVLSCPGAPGIGFDFEYSIRCWYHGYQVGLYRTGFKFDIGDHSHSGTRASDAAFQERKETEVHNNKMLYQLFPNFHHKEGTKMVAKAMKLLTAPKGWEPWTDESYDAYFAQPGSGEDTSKGFRINPAVGAKVKALKSRANLPRPGDKIG